MCIFNHFIYFALLHVHRFVFFVCFSYFVIFLMIILVKKNLSFRHYVYFSCQQERSLFLFHKFFILFFVHISHNFTDIMQNKPFPDAVFSSYAAFLL